MPIHCNHIKELSSGSASVCVYDTNQHSEQEQAALATTMARLNSQAGDMQADIAAARQRRVHARREHDTRHMSLLECQRAIQQLQVSTLWVCTVLLPLTASLCCCCTGRGACRRAPAVCH